MIGNNLQKHHPFTKTLLVLGFLLLSFQSSQAGIFSWLKDWGVEKTIAAPSILGSSISLTNGSSIVKGTTATVDFQVAVVSPDNEYVPFIAVQVPTGWSVGCHSNDGGLHGETVKCSAGSNLVKFTFGGTANPGLRNGDIWNFKMNVTVPATASLGSHSIGFQLNGNNIGAAPHMVQGAMTMSVISPDPTTVKAFAIQPSFINNVSNNDGYLQISKITGADKVNWVMGNDYVAAGGDTDYANAISVGAMPFKFATGLSNPAGAQNYTIRVFNGSSSFYKDTTLTMNENDGTVGCDCVENLYLNDTGLGEVHKFSVNPTDGTITEIGSPWLSGLNNPHGLGSDLNGNLYIGDHNQGPIFKLDCEGGTIADDATLWNTSIIEGLTNMGSIGNYIITNGHTNSTSGKDIHVLDACTGNLIGTICLNNAGSGPWSSDWGLQVFKDGTVIATDGQGFGPDSDRAIWKFQFNPSMINSSTCVDALVVNDYLSGIYDVVGITTDDTHLYVLTRDNGANTTLLKINATTGALVQSQYEGGWNGSGYNGALGLVYAPSSGYIYVSGYEDCVAIVDPSDLSYVGPGNGTIPSGSSPKAISILKECCPTNNNLVIDTIVTTSSLNDSIFLQELIDCSGTICQGVWSQGSNNVGLNYNACANTVRIDSPNGCGSFTLSYDGLGKYPQCGAFNITVNIKVVSPSIGNRIWLDEDGNGNQDAGEPGIPNVVVELQDGNCSSGVDCPTTITDANGGYIFKNVDLGDFTVKVLSGVPTGLQGIFDEDDSTTSPNMETVVTVAADEYVTADFGYNYVSKMDSNNPASTTITGALGDRIWNDANNNGMQDPGEAGIPNITVNLLTDTDLDGRYTPSGTTTTTDEYGNYIFDELAPGAYVVEVVASDISSAGFLTTPTTDPDNDGNNISKPVIIAPGDVWLGGDFGYKNSNILGDIGSKVFVDINGNGSFDSNDSPLGGVTIALVKDTDGGDDWDSDESIVATTITAADGSYLFPDLPAGDYVVVVTDVNNIIGKLTNTVDPQGSNDGVSGVTLAAVDNLTQNFGYAPKGHALSRALVGDMIFLDVDGGNDYDADEPGLEGVEVQLLNGTNDEIVSTTHTNENGQYFFGNLDAGDYKVKVVTSSLPAGLTNSVDPDGASPGDDITNSFALAALQKDLTKDFGYKATTQRVISGTIWEDVNTEGTLDGTETNRFENVTVMLLNADGNITSTTTTDASGSYSFTGIPSGSYTVEVTDVNDELKGYWHTIGTDSETDPVLVDATNGDVTDVDFGYYQKAASLGNTVWEDMDGDGIQDSNEDGLSGVVVTLEIDYDDDGMADVTVATLSGGDGSYSFDNLLLDEDHDGTGSSPAFKIKVTSPSGYVSTTSDVNSNGNDAEDADDPAGVIATAIMGETTMTKNVDPTLEPVAAQYDFGLVQTGVIGNRVWVDEDGDGDQDAGEPGIAGVVLELQNGICTSGADCPTTITDANGGYLFRNATPGTYTVKVISGVTGMEAIFDENDGTTTPDMETSVALNSGEEYLTADFGYNFVTKIATDAPASMTEPGALGDRVWNDANSNGVEDPGEAGIENITVNLYNDHDKDGFFDNLVNSTLTDANGKYIFKGLVPDAYAVEVVEAGIIGAGFDAAPTGDPDNDATNKSQPVVIAPGDVWLGGDFGYQNSNDLADIGSVVFVDVDGDGSFNVANDLPLGGVTMALVNDADGEDDWDADEGLVATTITDEDGAYLFPDLPAGDYVVVVTDVDNIINTLSNTVDPQGGNDGVSGVSLGASDELTQNFGYVPNGHSSAKGFIGDLIYLDQNGNGGYESIESGIEGVEVLLLNGDNDEELARTFTDENGMYFFGDLDADNYKVKVEVSSLPIGLTNSVDPDGSSPGDNITNSFSLAAGARDLTKDFGYKADVPRTISGTIWEDENAEGTLDGAESDRFANVTIDLQDADGDIIAQTTTDGTGAYIFTGLPSGNYTVEVTDDNNELGGFWHSQIANDNESDPVNVDVTNGNVTDVDFGYYKKAAALGNYVWLDYDYDGIQDSEEPGLEGSKVILEIDYDGGGADITVVRLAGLQGNYKFKHLLLDEDYQGDGAGTEPTFNLKVIPPNNHLFYISSPSKNSGGNDNLDGDDEAGVIATPQQGKNDVALTNVTENQSSYDFAFNFDCSQPSVEYAVTMDGSDPTAAQTTDYFITVVDGDTCHMPDARKYGTIRSYTYCMHGEWNYYFNPLDPEEYLFAIRHNSGGGATINTTEIEYIELRMEENAADRFSVGGDNANFVMMRDWHVKTKDDAPLTAPVDIRFYFPENEFADMYNSAINQATNEWGVGVPQVGEIKWFKKDIFSPIQDIDDDGSTLLAYDITSFQNAATDSIGVNSADDNVDGLQNVGQDKNHIQFNGLTGFSGGTAMLPIAKLSLPVKLSEFNARAEDCNVDLTWVTETETDFDYFELQWSGDGQDFRTIEKVEAKGGSFIRQYKYQDKTASEFNYYRLKMVDLDGSFEYSKIVQASTECENTHDVTIYPNPLSPENGVLNVKFYTERPEIQLQITDMLGRVVKRLTLDVESEFINTVQLDISDLPVGSYTMQIIGNRKSKIFTIQD